MKIRGVRRYRPTTPRFDGATSGLGFSTIRMTRSRPVVTGSTLTRRTGGFAPRDLLHGNIDDWWRSNISVICRKAGGVLSIRSSARITANTWSLTAG